METDRNRAGADGRLVYLSGPITAGGGRTVEEHVASALKVYLALVKRGVPTVCVHLGAIFPSAWTAVSYEEWMTEDLAVVAHCGAMVMLPGWEGSGGAVRERAYALSIGVTVFDSVEAFWREMPRERMRV